MQRAVRGVKWKVVWPATRGLGRSMIPALIGVGWQVADNPVHFTAYALHDMGAANADGK